MLVCVTPALQWARRYCPSGTSLIFERYFLLTDVLHVEWLLRRLKFLSILTSDAAARTVSPTCIMMASPFLKLLLMGSFYGTSCVKVWHKMSTKDGTLPHFVVGDPIMRLHKVSLTFTNELWSPPPGGFLEIIFLLSLPECLCILFEFGLILAVIFPA